MPDEQINHALTQVTSEPGRLVKLPGRAGTTLIDDTYNASLSSSLAALTALHSLPGARHIAFLGDMLELGSEEEAAHRSVLEQALAIADQVVLVGPRFARAAAELSAHVQQQPVLFPDWQAALTALQAGEIYQPAAGDVLLFKGSAGMRMERLVEHFLSPDIDARATLVRQGPEWR
jgi:UDP-N-acetylmuramoyl-tripeptide--D-alanyl-D-alanine ligase